MFTSSKDYFTFLIFFVIAMILWWVLHFKIAQKTGSLIFSIFELRFSYSRIFKIFTIFEKKLPQLPVLVHT